MNQRRAKAIRRMAEEAMLEWYSSLVSPEDAETLTIKDVKQYTPKSDYYSEEVEVIYHGVPHVAYIAHVAEHTQRWFYIQEKKKWGNL